MPPDFGMGTTPHSPSLTGIRPSLWARCPTAAVFQGRCEQEAELPPEAQEWFARGHLFEEYVVRQIIAKHGRDNVERQVEIDITGIGTGHADAYIKPIKTLVEVKSTTAPYPTADTFSYAVKQLRIYLAFHPEAEQGALYMLNPNTLKPADVYTVKLDDDEREEIASESEFISWSVRGDYLEPHGHDRRPCTKPSQARGRMCPFSAVCFDGWQPPDAGAIDDAEVLNAAAELAAIVEQERVHRAAIQALDDTKRQLKAALADVLPEKGETVVGPFVLRTWPVRGKVTVQAKALEAAGIDPYPFATVGEPRVEVRVERAEQAGEVDYGDSPF